MQDILDQRDPATGMASQEAEVGGKAGERGEVIDQAFFPGGLLMR